MSTCIVHALVIVILSVFFVLVHPQSLQGWANFLGVFGTVLASIQYFPQIWTTFTLKRVGSLSIPMMCIQTPGAFVWAASLAARLGKEGWSAWGVYVVTGCLQGTLLAMGIYYELMDRQQRKAAPEEVNGDTSGAVPNDDSRHDEQTERTPLLGS